jgi:cytochrome c-type biogenesis protein CcmH
VNQNRRAFLSGAAVAVLGGVAAGRLAGQEPSLPPQAETGSLRDPESAGRSQERATHRDNDPFVTSVEKRLQCTCGCTLDVYTCRTTDFTCTYSPALHKDVLALQDEGKNAEEIIAAFVAKYGEKVLMAPKPEGFNVAGYVVPGLLILLVGGVMLAILQRRARLSRPAVVPGAPPMPTAAVAGVVSAPPASTEELERLARELREMDQ